MATVDDSQNPATSAAATPDSTAAPIETAPPSPGPSPQAKSDASSLHGGVAVRVMVGELNVRDLPTTSAERAGTVDRGVVFVLGGYEPVAADGYVWWAASEVTNAADGDLLPLPTPPETWVGLRGFVAVSHGATPYVEVLALRCPGIVDVAHVVAMLGSERAGCFEDRPLTLEGTLTCGACEGLGPPETFEPWWLADTRVGPDLAVSGTGAQNGLRLQFPPEINENIRYGGFLEGKVPFGSILRIVGHFNDPRSSTCTIGLYVDDATSHAVAPAYAEQACRQHFAVESYEVLGTDPAYTSPY